VKTLHMPTRYAEIYKPGSKGAVMEIMRYKTLEKGSQKKKGPQQVGNIN